MLVSITIRIEPAGMAVPFTPPRPGYGFPEWLAPLRFISEKPYPAHGGLLDEGTNVGRSRTVRTGLWYRLPTRD